MYLVKITAFASMLAVAPSVDAEGPVNVDVYVDTRLTLSSGERSFYQDNLGKTRYGSDSNGDSNTKLRLAEVAILTEVDIAWGWKAFANIKYDTEQNKPADIVEGFVTYKPVPTSQWSYEFKAGLFFPHISRENVGIAWTSPYTITPSAINTWVGEEIKVLGAEAKATYKAEAHEVSFSGSIFGFNDPAGTLLAFRGWALHDVKTGAFSSVPLAPLNSIGGGEDVFLQQALFVKPVAELDNKPGFYAALDYTYNDWLQLGAFYYDNRGNPEEFNGSQYAWDTRFLNVYAEADVGAGVKLISQFMTGKTEMGVVVEEEGRRYVDIDYRSAFFLATKKFGDFRISARYDWFDVEDNSFLILDNNAEDGDAITLAGSWKIGTKDTIIAEFLHTNSNRGNRIDLDSAPRQSSNQLQISYRKTF